jgi:cytochrome c peroxidase
LLQLIDTSLLATDVYTADSTTTELNSYHHFFLCNRLFLLNLAALYTTGFECPSTERIIPELKVLLGSVQHIYGAYNKTYATTPLTTEYLQRYSEMIAFVNKQPEDHTLFDHYTFIKNYVNPLYAINQQMVKQYHVVSHNLIDYSLNKDATSIFDKKLYNGQNAKGVFIRVNDAEGLAKIDAVGKQLFYDPILSGNNMRSCASCHKPKQYFTDTAVTTAPNFNQQDRLPRNTPSLVNVVYNHLIMLDGKHINLQNQCKAVINSKDEMNCGEAEMLKKVLSCKEYKSAFRDLLQYTPYEKEITFDHIASVITFYYSKFSNYYSPFDNAINGKGELTASATHGFNLFMGKAQCGTCHFVPQFNGVKPPYIGSEFEVLGVPADTAFKKLSADQGRYGINPATETRNAFRTGSLRNTPHMKPYMHNGVFKTLEEVIAFYDAGGGTGRGLSIENQTLSADSLKLTPQEKQDLIAFMQALDENIVFEEPPVTLPRSKNKVLNNRIVGGTY